MTTNTHTPFPSLFLHYDLFFTHVLCCHIKKLKPSPSPLLEIKEDLRSPEHKWHKVTPIQYAERQPKCRRWALVQNKSEMKTGRVSRSTLAEICERLSVPHLSRWVTGPLRCLVSVVPPHPPSLWGWRKGGARRLPPSLIFTSVTATTPWQLKGGDLAYPDAAVTLRCPRPENPWPLWADGGPGAIETRKLCQI